MRKSLILPQYVNLLEQLGENIKLARKRRNLSTIQVAERSSISRSTLNLIEKGDPGVAIGNYFNVLRTLGLQNDIKEIAADDKFGRKLQDLNLLK